MRNKALKRLAEGKVDNNRFYFLNQAQSDSKRWTG